LHDRNAKGVKNASALPEVSDSKPQTTSRLVELPAFLSNFRDIRIKIKPDLAIGLQRIFRSQSEKNKHEFGSQASIDDDVRDAVFEILNIMGPSSTHIDHTELENLINFILENPAFSEFKETQAYGLNITTPLHTELLAFRILKYIYDQAHMVVGGRIIRPTRKNNRRVN